MKQQIALAQEAADRKNESLKIRNSNME